MSTGASVNHRRRWRGAVWGLCALVTSATAEQRPIRSAAELSHAMASATPGTTLVIAPGNYRFQRLETRTAGTAEAPIVVRAARPGTVTLQATGVELFSVRHAYWTFQDLIIQGGAQTDHAFHIVGAASHVTLKGNVIRDFHSPIKINGTPGNQYPDNGLIEGNDLYNRSARATGAPVTLIDLVAGSGWIVRDNYLADFAKNGGDFTSYGLFMKGNSDHGLIERNLVICARDVPTSGTRVGLSLGGGGTGTPYCRHQNCAIEHRAGVIRNNIVLNCSDVGIYLNRASETLVAHNTLLMTTGIDVRFPTSSATVMNNVLTGSVRERDGGSVQTRDNLSFGSTYGMWMPTITHKLQHRISDYDSKYPSWVSRAQVLAWQTRLEVANRWISERSAGLGQAQMLTCFPGLVVGDLTPSGLGCEGLSGAQPLVGEDFWGHPRTQGLSDRGAIDFHASQGNVLARLQRLAPGAPLTEGAR